MPIKARKPRMWNWGVLCMACGWPGQAHLNGSSAYLGVVRGADCLMFAPLTLPEGKCYDDRRLSSTLASRVLF